MLPERGLEGNKLASAEKSSAEGDGHGTCCLLSSREEDGHSELELAGQRQEQNS